LSWIESLLLGILQGLTEFLPISSSGHLVVGQFLLDLQEPGVTYEVAVHVGTLAAVVAYYRGLIAEHAVGCFRKEGGESRRLLGMIVAASIPTAIIGLLFEDEFEAMFSSPIAVGCFWILTGIVLVLVPRMRPGEHSITQIRVLDAVVIGIAQGLAILPGVSRSGATIAAGMSRGVRPADAASFSFLISIPAILGATVLQMDSLTARNGQQWGVYLVGAVAAAVVGYLAIALLIRLLNRRIIRPFGWYCIIAGALTVISLLVAR